MTEDLGTRAGLHTGPRTLPDTVVAGAGLAALAGLVLLAQQPFSRGITQLVLTLGMFGVFVPAARAAERLAEPASLRLAVLGGTALQIVALRVRPWTTDDHLRYAWDGRVQASGTDPYRYPPGAPELAGLRDAWLFPDGVTPALNHPTVRTIYPPVAQAWFWLVHVLSGGRGQGLQLQVAAALVAVAVSIAVVVVLRGIGHDPRRVVWWAWCPAVVLEAGGNAHIDVLGAFLVVVALGLVCTWRWWTGGLVLGLAAAAKFVPALVAVGVPPRRSLRVALAAASAVALVYAPHVAVLGSDVGGFLGGYLAEERNDRYDLLRFMLPDVLAAPAGVAVLTATALHQWRSAGRRDALGQPPQPWNDAAVLVGVSFLVVTPAYPWYALLLVALVALGAPRIWLVVAAAVYPVYAAAALGDSYYTTRVVSYGLAAVVLLVASSRARTATRH